MKNLGSDKHSIRVKKRSVSFLSSSHGVSLRHSMLLHSYRRPFTLFTSYPASTRSIRLRPGFTGGTEDEAGVSDRRTGITSDVDRKLSVS